jgi:DNA polymerase-3 subunit delta
MSQTRTHSRQNSIFIIAGKETSLVNVECDRVLDGIIEPQQRLTGLFKPDADEVCAADVLDELRTAPFLTKKRVVLVKNADKFISANREPLEKYFDNPCPTGVLIMTVTTWDGRTKLARKLPEVGTLINAAPPKGIALSRRLMQYSYDAHRKKLAPDAAQLLIELAGDELPRLYSEIDKLAVFADAEKTIMAGHVEALIGHNRFFNAFAVIDGCLTGNSGKAVNRLRKMFAEDRTAEYTAVGAFAYHLRQIFNAKLMLTDGVRPHDVVKKLRIFGNHDAFFLAVRKMPLEKIGNTLQQLADIDYAIKTGQTRAEVAIEKLVLELAAAYKGT